LYIIIRNVKLNKMVGFNLSRGSATLGLGNSDVFINLSDGSLVHKISDHLSLNMKDGGIDFTL